ncbi:MAG TPA: hypothetical protein PKY02_08895, partial [Synergistales bacterium]|nr:hypothetical protein [Synergistales bacterium]
MALYRFPDVYTRLHGTPSAPPSARYSPRRRSWSTPSK